MELVVIGNPDNRRVAFFREAAARVANQSVTVLSYNEWLSGSPLPPITAGSIIKIDSPGEHAGVRNQLIQLGGVQPDLIQPHGIISHLKSWYTGYCMLLDDITRHLPPHRYRYMNHPAAIRLQFNKPACQQLLQQHQVAVPRMLPQVHNYDALIQAMQQQHIRQVFIKPAHASSASGVIAFRKNGSKVQAITSAETDYSSGKLQLFNSLRVRTYQNESEVAAIINAIAAEGVQTEEWIPKATLNNRYFDIRVLVIAGEARHTVLRTSKQIITNLHLGNKRGSMEDFISRFGASKLAAVHHLAEQTAACFPDTLYMGIDILIAANGKDMYVLEVNAFGDLLPGLLHKNENSYEAELTAMLKKEIKPL